MSTWEAPRTWIANQRVTPSQLNEVRDNLNYLKNRPIDVITLDEASNYSTTTQTTWLDINASTLTATVEVSAAGRVEINMVAAFYATTNAGILNLDVYMAGDDTIADGRLGLDDGMLPHDISTTLTRSCQICRVITGLSAGLHTFKLQWKLTSTGGTGGVVMLTGNTSAGAGTDVHPQFSVRDI